MTDVLETNAYHYQLPDELIAKYPLAQRSASRLMQLQYRQQQITHCHFHDLVDILNDNDLLVFNDTKVFPARLYGQKLSGGKVECLVERILDEHRVLAHLKSSKSPKPGSQLLFADSMPATMVKRHDELFELEFQTEQSILDLLQKHGHMPLPPYIDRDDDESDIERYQTIHAKYTGSVAAPTAGLHFDEQLVQKLKDKGVTCSYLTLHVGAGTFQPVRSASLSGHKMHSEYMTLSQSVVDAVAACKARGGRVIAVGTTSVRALETAAKNGQLQPYQGETDIFIYPGFEFQCVDGLITNFHLPESTLLMLVSALAGREFILKAYQDAVEQRYRFYSYGDAMVII